MVYIHIALTVVLFAERSGVGINNSRDQQCESSSFSMIVTEKAKTACVEVYFDMGILAFSVLPHVRFRLRRDG